MVLKIVTIYNLYDVTMLLKIVTDYMILYHSFKNSN